MIDKNRIYNENNLITMNKMPDNFLDGILCSPPYNIAVKRKDGYYNTGYSEMDDLTEEKYIELRLNEFKEFQRVVKDDGVICYNISYAKDNPILPLLLMTEIHNKTDLTVTDMISWKKTHSTPFQSSPNKLSRLVEIVYIIVNKKYLNTFKANKQVSKINEKTGQKFYKYYSNFIEAKNNDSPKTKLKALYSSELVEKLINLYFPEDSIIYDPFMGSGTTAKGCIITSRNFIGSEISEEFYNDSLINIDNFK